MIGTALLSAGLFCIVISVLAYRLFVHSWREGVARWTIVVRFLLTLLGVTGTILLLLGLAENFGVYSALFTTIVILVGFTSGRVISLFEEMFTPRSEEGAGFNR